MGALVTLFSTLLDKVDDISQEKKATIIDALKTAIKIQESDLAELKKRLEENDKEVDEK